MLQRIPVFWKLMATCIIILLLVLAISNYSNNLVAITITIVLGCGCTWVIVYNHFKRLIRELVNGMNLLAEKEFDFRLDEDREDTFESLSSFNDMASMLASSMNELKKNQDYLRSILESSADLIITLNSSGKIQTINSSAENVLGHNRNDVIGQSIEIILADPQDRKVAARKLQFSENVVDYETQFVTKDKKVRDVSLTLSRLRSPAGTVIGTIVLGKDITDEKHLQNEIIQSQPYVEIGQVFTGIQHSMKNMLNACKGGAYMVRTGLTNDNRKMLEEGWDMVEEGISKLTNMSSNMLKYVKEWKARCSTVDLGQLLIDIHHVCKQNAVDNNVDFQLNISPELPPVFCDGQMIHSVVMDIVSNAFDACLWKDYKPGTAPKIAIGASACPERQEVVIQIKDNGCGMTKDVKENIFVPFFSTKSRAGTGLGLSIASRMIAVHGGKIDVESEANVGTVFHITLPIDGSGANKEHTNGEKGSGR